MILTALAALMNAFGFSSCKNISNNFNYFYDCALEHFGGASHKNHSNIKSFKDLYDIDGTNKYLLVEYDDSSFSIYDKEQETIVKELNDNPFNNIDTELCIFSKADLGFEFAYFNSQENTINTIEGQILTSNWFNSIISPKAPEGTWILRIPGPDAHLIENWRYFSELGATHAFNYGATCTVISAEILLAYYDTFENDNIIPENYDRIAANNFDSLEEIDIKKYWDSPGVDDCSKQPHDNKFHDYLVNFTKSHYLVDPTFNGMTVFTQCLLIDDYLSLRGVGHTMNTSHGNLADWATSKAVKVIKNGIDNNRPVIASGIDHSIVAYGYDDDYVYVHTGYGYVAATRWATFESTLFSNWVSGAIDITSIENHVHSNNYYVPNLDAYICPCGHIFKSTHITPAEFGFEGQYYFYEKENTFSKNQLIIETKRLRTGFIENEFINLSPARAGAGHAYLEMNFNKSVRSFNIWLSYWQAVDKLSSLDSTAYLSVKKAVFQSDNQVTYEWVTVKDLIAENLTTDRYDQDGFFFEYIGNEIYGIKIESTSLAAGSRNLGRISLGYLQLLHSL